MSGSREIEILELRREFLDDVVRIHRNGLGYSLNSRLGDDHLAFLYESLLVDPNSYVGVAVDQGRPVGVVSGCINVEASKSRLLGSMSPRRRLVVAAKLLIQPALVLSWWRGRTIDGPVHYEGEEVTAGLTAIAVEPAGRGIGTGSLLVGGLETFFGGRFVRYYRLDTLTENAQARKFYNQLGFREIGVRANGVVLVKAIGQ